MGEKFLQQKNCLVSRVREEVVSRVVQANDVLRALDDAFPWTKLADKFNVMDGARVQEVHRGEGCRAGPRRDALLTI